MSSAKWRLSLHKRSAGGIVLPPPPAPLGLYTFNSALLDAEDKALFDNLVSKVDGASFRGYNNEAISNFDTVTSVADAEAAWRFANQNRTGVWTRIKLNAGGNWAGAFRTYPNGGTAPIPMGNGGGIILVRGDVGDPNIEGQWSLSGATRTHIEGLRFTMARAADAPDFTKDSTNQIVIGVTGDNGGLSPENAFFASQVAFKGNRFGMGFDPAKDGLPDDRAVRALYFELALSAFAEDNDFHRCWRGIISARSYLGRFRNNRFGTIVLNPFTLSTTERRTQLGLHPENKSYLDVDNNFILPPPDNLDGSVQGDAPHIDLNQFPLYDAPGNHTPSQIELQLLMRSNFVLCDNVSFYMVGGTKKGAIINGHIHSDYSGLTPHKTIMVGNIGATNGFSIQDGANGQIVYAYNTWGAPPRSRPGPEDSNSNAFGKATNYGTVNGGVPSFKAYRNIHGGIDGDLAPGSRENINMNWRPSAGPGSRPQDFLEGTWENTSHDAGFWQAPLAWQGLTIAQQKALLFAQYKSKPGVNAGAKLTAPA